MVWTAASNRRDRTFGWRTAAIALPAIFALALLQPSAAAASEAAGFRTSANPSIAPLSGPQVDDVGVRRDGPSALGPTSIQLRPCDGTDLVEALRASDPAGFEAFENAARGVVNGQGLLWRVERAGGGVSYLFGTMHSSDAEAKRFDELVTRALGRSRVVAMELPGASTRTVAAELRRLVSNRSFRVGGDSLAPLPSDIRPAVDRRIQAAGIAPSVARQLQPWFLALALSRSTCASPTNRHDPETADGRIERLAAQQGSTILGLETPLEQVDALASVPDDVALRMLRDATERGMRPEDVERTISGLYQTRRIGYLLAMRGPAWAGVFDVDGYAEFLNAFITRRNAAMLQRALSILAAGDAFLAVGALHLPGEKGLVELIRRSGYTVTRLW